MNANWSRLVCATVLLVTPGLLRAGETPLVITNKDLPTIAKVSIVGTLKVVELQPDTAWIERVDAMVRELETDRQRATPGPANPRRLINRDYCAVGPSEPVDAIGVNQVCINGICLDGRRPLKPEPLFGPVRACVLGVCPDGHEPLEILPFFGVKKPGPPREIPGPHLVDALPAPAGGFAGRPGKHLGLAQ